MANREDYEKWIADYENPSGPDRWIDPWTWAKAMKDVLEQLDLLEEEVKSLKEELPKVLSYADYLKTQTFP